jgi:hypothetical protein
MQTMYKYSIWLDLARGRDESRKAKIETGIAVAAAPCERDPSADRPVIDRLHLFPVRAVGGMRFF